MNKKNRFFTAEKLLSASVNGINNDITSLNDLIAVKGLYLTQNDVREVVRTRTRALAENCRFEIGTESVRKITESIFSSQFVDRSNFCDTLCTFIRIFYYIKTASFDSIPDDDVVRLLKDMYENVCYGSLSEMKGREVDMILHYIETEKAKKASNGRKGEGR